jgi:hypothetical protein
VDLIENYLDLGGLSVDIELQKRQCTVRSHELITDNYCYILYHCPAIYSGKREQLEYNIQSEKPARNYYPSSRC